MHATSFLRTALLVAIAFLLIACARQDNDSSIGEAASATEDAAMAADASDAKGAATTETAPQPTAPEEGEPGADQVISSASTYTDAQRKFIRTAKAQFRVADVYKAALAIEDVVADNGGFVVRNEIESVDQGSRTWPQGNATLRELTEYSVRGSLTVRVPSDRAQPFLRSILARMEHLDRRSFEAMDAQFALLREQLAFQRHQQAQQSLGDATDQGGRLPQKVSAIDARSGAQAARDEAVLAQREFEDRVAFATLELLIYQQPRLRWTERVDLDAAARASGPSFASRLGHAMHSGWRGMLVVLVELARVWPLWAVGLLVLLAYRRLRKNA